MLNHASQSPEVSKILSIAGRDSFGQIYVTVALKYSRSLSQPSSGRLRCSSSFLGGGCGKIKLVLAGRLRNVPHCVDCLGSPQTLPSARKHSSRDSRMWSLAPHLSWSATRSELVSTQGFLKSMGSLRRKLNWDVQESGSSVWDRTR